MADVDPLVYARNDVIVIYPSPQDLPIPDRDGLKRSVRWVRGEGSWWTQNGLDRLNVIMRSSKWLEDCIIRPRLAPPLSAALMDEARAKSLETDSIFHGKDGFVIKRANLYNWEGVHGRREASNAKSSLTGTLRGFEDWIQEEAQEWSDPVSAFASTSSW